MNRRRVGIIGGGLGGLSAAIRVALAGHHVVLFERTGMLGGKAGRFQADGFSFDTGPSLVTLPEAIEDLLVAAGTSCARELPLQRLDPQCRYLFTDGRSLDLRDRLEDTLQNVAAFAPGDESGFAQALGLSQRIYESVGRPFLNQPFEGVSALARMYAGNPLDALRYGALQGSLGSVAERATRHDALRWIIKRYATYAGGGPARTPAAFAMILHVESAMGAWYPSGGIYSIVAALGRVAATIGVEIRLNAPVERIVTHGRRISGVLCEGTLEQFDAVIANADPVTVAKHLLEPGALSDSGLAKHADQELGLSGAVLLLGLRGKVDALAHHTVLFPKAYDQEFTDLFEHRVIPQDPTVYCCTPSRTDPTRAPEGCESIFCMINAPPLAAGEAFTPQRPLAIQRIKRALRQVVPDLDQRILVEEFIGPDELSKRFSAPGGSIYGVSPHGWQSPFHRPRQRAEGIAGLYFAGGGTHPGGGIPLVIRSGQFAAQLLQRDLESSGLTRAVEPAHALP